MKKVGLVLSAAVMMLAMGTVGLAEGARAEGEIITGNKSLCDPDSGVSDDLKAQAGCDLTKQDTAPSVIQSLVNVAIGVIGIGAVAAMIYGGFIYTTSTGDAAKIRKARDIILYGAVGLIVAIMAFAIVTFINTSVTG